MLGVPFLGLGLKLGCEPSPPTLRPQTQGNAVDPSGATMEGPCRSCQKDDEVGLPWRKTKARANTEPHDPKP